VPPGQPGPVGRFLGGAIAPGPQLLSEALARRGARLFPVETHRAQTPALGRETSEALASGIVHGFRGAARELVTRIALEGQVDSPLIVLTGGASELLEGVFDEVRLLRDAQLVQRGLHAALVAERERCSNSAS
jgi:type III pantothenate kinase